MLLVYNEPLHRGKRTQKQLEAEKNLISESSKYNGYMSNKTKSKVTKMLGQWVPLVRDFNKQLKKRRFKQYITFVTLTLTEKQKEEHTDNFLKRELLMRFVEIAKTKPNFKYYFWRAEPQKNGNIHFHLIIDCFWQKDDLKQEWNKLLNRHGYKSSPASTQIHKIRHIDNVLAYVCKYVCKVPVTNEEKEKLAFREDYEDIPVFGEEYRKINGRIWGCSDELRLLVPYHSELDSVHRELVDKLKDDVDVRHVPDIDGQYEIFYYPAMKDKIARYSDSISFKFREHNLNQLIELYKTGLRFQETAIQKVEEIKNMLVEESVPRVRYEQGELFSFSCLKDSECPF